MNTEEDVARGLAVSVYMDGELPVEQRDRLLLSLKSDAALRHDWLVYHCIGDALRSEDAVPLTNGFGSRLKTRLEGEPFLFAPEVSKVVFAAQRASGAQRWRMPVAVAASVAAVVTAGLLVLPQRGGVQNQQIAQSAAPVSLAASGGAQPPAAAQSLAAVQPSSLPASRQTGEMPASANARLPVASLVAGSAVGAADAGMGGAPALPIDPALRAVSSEYLMAHRHYSTGLVMRGVVSHVRTAGYDGQ